MLDIIGSIINPDAHIGECVLATIIERMGSAPRSSGTRMVVYPDGSIRGTIGGGKLEAGVIANAKQLLSKDGIAKDFLLTDVEFSGQDASSMDMICGGKLKVLLERLSLKKKQEGGADISNASSIDFYRLLFERLHHREPTWMITSVDPINGVQHGLVDEATITTETHLTLEQIKDVRFIKTFIFGSKLQMVERLNLGGEVILFGAGHVAQPVAALCSQTDFCVTVVDDRADFANPERFPTTERILTPASIEKVFSDLEVGEDSFVVIVTRGHLQDEIVLEWALTTRAGYIGMIGSRRKWRLIQESLQAKGFSQENIARVHSPIGLNIGAETPTEIAVSIVGELIAHRAKKAKGSPPVQFTP